LKVKLKKLCNVTGDQAEGKAKAEAEVRQGTEDVKDKVKEKLTKV